jgi:hypothetical protein
MYCTKDASFFEEIDDDVDADSDDFEEVDKAMVVDFAVKVVVVRVLFFVIVVAVG